MDNWWTVSTSRVLAKRKRRPDSNRSSCVLALPMLGTGKLDLRAVKEQCLAANGR